MFFDVNVFHLQGASPRKCLPCKIKLMVCIILSPLVREALFLFSVVPQKFHRAELNQTLQPWIGIWIGFAILKDHPAIPKCVLAWQCVTCTRFLVSAASKWSTFYLYCASLISTLSLSRCYWTCIAKPLTRTCPISFHLQSEAAALACFSVQFVLLTSTAPRALSSGAFHKADSFYS